MGRATKKPVQLKLFGEPGGEGGASRSRQSFSLPPGAGWSTERLGECSAGWYVMRHPVNGWALVRVAIELSEGRLVKVPVLYYRGHPLDAPSSSPLARYSPNAWTRSFLEVLRELDPAGADEYEAAGRGES